ncbi:MAG: hypothetical protein QM765_33190 [Myxococcales bacterium]
MSSPPPNAMKTGEGLAWGGAAITWGTPSSTSRTHDKLQRSASGPTAPERTECGSQASSGAIAGAPAAATVRSASPARAARCEPFTSGGAMSRAWKGSATAAKPKAWGSPPVAPK